MHTRLTASGATHKLLARQLRRKAGIASDAELASAIAGLAAVAGDEPSAAARLAQALPSLLTEVENTYRQFDRDLKLRRRSLEISSEELLYLNNQLRAEAASRQRALDSLREAANRLLSGAGLPVLQED
jgi:two-component system sensor histidine kinase/response regulator